MFLPQHLMYLKLISCATLASLNSTFITLVVSFAFRLKISTSFQNFASQFKILAICCTALVLTQS